MSTDFVPIIHEPIELKSRKILRKTCEFFHYGVGEYVQPFTKVKQAAQVEDMYWKGKLVGQHLRLPEKQFAWVGDSKQVELWGMHLWSSNKRTIIITEGALDTMSIAQATDFKIPVVSLTGGVQRAPSDIKRNLEKLSEYEKIVLAFDNDEPGKEGIEKCIPLLPLGKTYVINLGTFKDANEMLQAGQAGKLAEMCYNPEVYRPGGVISGGELWEDLVAPYETGISIPFPKLQYMLDGMRKGKLYMFTAGSGVGKSTLVRQLGYDLMMRNNRTIGVMALEDSKKDSAKLWAGLHLQKDLLHSQTIITSTEYKKAYDEVLNNGRFWLYDHWGSSQIDVLLQKISYMTISLGVEYLVLDHISIVVSGLDDDFGDNERRMIDKLMTRLRSLINSTGITVLAIVHLKRKNDSKGYNEGGIVKLADLRGSGSLEQLSDVVISAERDQQGDQPNVVQLRVLKNRPAKRTGLADLLIYNIQTGWLVPYDAALVENNKGQYNADF